MKTSFARWRVILSLTLLLVAIAFLYNSSSKASESIPKVDTSQQAQLNTQSAQKKLRDPIKGITLGMHSKDPRYDYSLMIDEIASFKSEWVCLNIRIYQKDNKRSELEQINEGFAKQLNRTLSHCKKVGLKVMINPIIHFRDNDASPWRGGLSPTNDSLWFKNYFNTLSNIIELSREHNVEVLGIGSELNALQTKTEHWVNLITKIRKGFDGQITYSANWDLIENLGFINELDFLGVSAYYGLSDSDTPRAEELEANWLKAKIYLMYLQEIKFQKPIVLTEVGYASQNGTSMEPWNYLKSDEVDLKEQEMCFAAFTKVWKDEPGFNGVFFYDWFGEGGVEDLGYTFKGKPASHIIESWF